MSDFEKDVLTGLSQFPKRISSRYFYDQNGDAIFQQITKLPEYYLTKAENEILRKEALIEHLKTYFKNDLDIYELGAGDGTKTRILLKNLKNHGLDFHYFPIDISSSVLAELVENLSSEFERETIQPIQGTYFETLEKINRKGKRKKLVLFLGSNIGNLLHPEAIKFLSRLEDCLYYGDQVMIGFDLVKDPKTILRAYDDPQKVTSRFNKNLLVRINRELNGNFKLDRFEHQAVYNPESGTCSSYLISLEDQVVEVSDEIFSFYKWETIHTEISQKYTHKVINWLAEKSGLKSVANFRDSQAFFADYLFIKNKIDVPYC
jgi:dimethylhistidine N-methyltransferase